MARALSNEEARRLLNKDKHAPTTQHSADRADSFFKEYADVILENWNDDTIWIANRLFIIAKRRGSDTIFIKPSLGYTPCGWLTRGWLKQAIL